MPLLFLALLSSLVPVQGLALPRSIPYIPQTEALCGGAAAAMVMRYWGADARAEDFAALIDPAQNGIVTTSLVADLKRRGWQAFPLRGGLESEAFVAHLRRGRPLIALIEAAAGRFHYVTIAGTSEAQVFFHDPAVAPDQRMPRAEFDRRWQAANFWMLLLLPGTTPPDTRATPDAPLADEVARLLRQGDTAQALQLSREATISDPASAVAWDALATTLFVMDRELDALDAWNRAGKPDVDTVQIAGLRRTRFRVAERMIALEPGDRLTATRLARARRRLSLLPSAISSRVSYTPTATGRAQIDAAIVEHPRTPDAADLIAAGARAPFTRDIQLFVTNLVGSGERVIASWRFREGFERIEAAVETPAPIPFGAAWRINGFDSRETYDVGGERTQQRWQRAAWQAADWINGRTGWVAAAGYERWPDAPGLRDREKIYAALRGVISFAPHVDAHVTAEGWMRGSGATRLSALGRFTSPLAGGRITLIGGTSGVHGFTPRFILPGAGGGQIRSPTLRAHRLVDDGAITVDEGQIFGRRLVHGTAEWSHPIRRIMTASIDGALFADAARAWQLLDGSRSNYQVDAGAGVRVRLPAGAPTLRFDIARGLRDGRWRFSAGTILSLERWIE